MADGDAARPAPPLVRRLGTGDAVVLGLGSMLGAGVFVAWGPAARAAGPWLLLGLGLAAGVAWCNALASAQLAAVYPVSGGTYVYGRERLGHWWGFAAGWCFVIGKTASCAAMALTFAAYAVPGPVWRQRLVAVGAVLALAASNSRGVTRTARLTRVLVGCTVLGLTVFVGSVLIAGRAAGPIAGPTAGVAVGGGRGVLQAAGLLFFAFAGYARIATMGEEVRNPQTTVPRAIRVALLVAVGVYGVVGLTVLRVGGSGLLARSPSPLAAVAATAGLPAVVTVVRITAALACLGSLLALLAGIGRTGLAMARERDLPAWLAAVHPRYRVPHRVEGALAVAVSVLVLTTDLRGALGFSSFGVLLYYAVANLAAATQPPADRRWPRALNVAGVLGCVVLALALPRTSVAAGVATVAVGLLGRWLVRLARRRRSTGRGT